MGYFASTFATIATATKSYVEEGIKTVTDEEFKENFKKGMINVGNYTKDSIVSVGKVTGDYVVKAGNATKDLAVQGFETTKDITTEGYVSIKKDINEKGIMNTAKDKVNSSVDYFSSFFGFAIFLSTFIDNFRNVEPV